MSLSLARRQPVRKCRNRRYLQKPAPPNSVGFHGSSTICHICQERFNTSSSLHYHFREEHFFTFDGQPEPLSRSKAVNKLCQPKYPNSGSFICKKCPNESNSEGSLTLHSISVHRFKPTVCIDCGVTLTCLLEYNSHKCANTSPVKVNPKLSKSLLPLPQPVPSTSNSNDQHLDPQKPYKTTQSLPVLKYKPRSRILRIPSAKMSNCEIPGSGSGSAPSSSKGHKRLRSGLNDNGYLSPNSAEENEDPGVLVDSEMEIVTHQSEADPQSLALEEGKTMKSPETEVLAQPKSDISCSNSLFKTRIPGKPNLSLPNTAAITQIEIRQNQTRIRRAKSNPPVKNAVSNLPGSSSSAPNPNVSHMPVPEAQPESQTPIPVLANQTNNDDDLMDTSQIVDPKDVKPGMSVYGCWFCELLLKTKAALNLHFLAHDDPPLISDPEGEAQVDLEDEERESQLEIPTPLAVPKPETITHSKSLKKQEQLFCCSHLQCEESFKTMEELTSHITEEHDIIPEQIQKQSNGPDNGRNLLLCDVCPRTFDSAFTLGLHKSFAHGGAGDITAGNSLDVNFQNKLNLNQDPGE